MKRGTFCGEHSEKGTCFDILSTLCMFLNPLFKHRYQADLEAPPRGVQEIVDLSFDK